MTGDPWDDDPAPTRTDRERALLDAGWERRSVDSGSFLTRCEWWSHPDLPGVGSTPVCPPTWDEGDWVEFSQAELLQHLREHPPEPDLKPEPAMVDSSDPWNDDNEENQ